MSNRVTKTRKIIVCLNDILWSKDTKKKKFNIYKAMAKSITLCGCETWRLTERSKNYGKNAIRRSIDFTKREGSE
jgi:hypothetical protein